MNFKDVIFLEKGYILPNSNIPKTIGIEGFSSMTALLNAKMCREKVIGINVHAIPNVYMNNEFLSQSGQVYLKKEVKSY